MKLPNPTETAVFGCLLFVAALSSAACGTDDEDAGGDVRVSDAEDGGDVGDDSTDEVGLDVGLETGLEVGGDVGGDADTGPIEPPPDPCDYYDCVSVCEQDIVILPAHEPSTFVVDHRVPSLPAGGGVLGDSTFTSDGLFLDIFDADGAPSASTLLGVGGARAVVRGDLLVFGPGQVSIVDISDPAAPRHVASWGNTSARSMTEERVLLDLGDVYALVGFDDPLAPNEIACIPNPEADGWSFWGSSYREDIMVLDGVLWPEGDGGPASTFMYDLRVADPAAGRTEVEVEWETPSIAAGHFVAVPRGGDVFLYDLSTPGEVVERGPLPSGLFGSGFGYSADTWGDFVVTEGATKAVELGVDPPREWAVESDAGSAANTCRATLRADGHDPIVLLPRHRPGERFGLDAVPEVSCESSSLEDVREWIRTPSGRVLVGDDDGYGELNLTTFRWTHQIERSGAIGATNDFWVFHQANGGDWGARVYDELQLISIDSEDGEGFVVETTSRIRHLDIGLGRVWLIAETEARIYDDPAQPPEDWGLFRTSVGAALELERVDLPDGFVPSRVVAVPGGAWVASPDGRLITVGDLPAVDVVIPVSFPTSGDDYPELERRDQPIGDTYGVLIADGDTLLWVDTEGAIRTNSDGWRFRLQGSVDGEVYAYRETAPVPDLPTLREIVLAEPVADGEEFVLEIAARLPGNARFLPGDPLMITRSGPTILTRDR